MLWGFPWSVPWGDHDSMIESLDVADIGAGPRVRIVAESGLPQYMRIVVDGVPQGSPVWCKTGVTTELDGIWQHDGTTGHIVNVCPQGDWNTKDVDLSAQVDSFASGRARRISIEIAPTVGVFSTSAQLSGWANLTGLRRFQNCGPVTAHPSWARVKYILTDSAGTRTLVLYHGSTTLASGASVGDGSITLSAVDSGVSGDVNVTYTGNESGSVYLVWPASYAIHYQTGGVFTGASFPRTAESTLYDNGQSNLHYWASSVLPAATYYVVVHQVDEAGNESTGIAGGGTSVTTYGPPARPSGMAYVTGDATATTISFSGGSGATGYLIYDSHSGVIDMSAPTTTVSDSGNQILTGIAAAYSGYRYVVVRSTVGGVDDGNSNQLRIEYSGGAVVLPRPPSPGLGPNITVDGRTIRVPVSVSLAEYDALPAYIELYAWDAATGSFDSGTPLSTGTIATGTMRVGTEIVLVVSGTAAADGEFYYLVRSRSSAGIASSNSDYAGPVRLTTTLPANPNAFTVKVS